MKLLVDENLPRSLAVLAGQTFRDSVHVLDIEPRLRTDAEIFDYAAENGFTIISKDSDFRQLSFVRPTPPKVLWLRVGNCNVAELRRIFAEHRDRIAQFESESENFLVIES